ncbi:hypothetical protein DFP72DRAFT_1049972 [Ephemerocybe angulata]|uniref:Uncharacterized protein n=1 Tax=Ephemerocybe angulata TaxID=980116 RepID=A0A8H6HK94_9AGAR|nr:hypothetical protein DFP72DRAFT_1049972 [Tulosesus angulatus]
MGFPVFRVLPQVIPLSPVRLAGLLHKSHRMAGGVIIEGQGRLRAHFQLQWRDGRGWVTVSWRYVVGEAIRDVQGGEGASERWGAEETVCAGGRGRACRSRGSDGEPLQDGQWDVAWEHKRRNQSGLTSAIQLGEDRVWRRGVGGTGASDGKRLARGSALVGPYLGDRIRHRSSCQLPPGSSLGLDLHVVQHRDDAEDSNNSHFERVHAFETRCYRFRVYGTQDESQWPDGKHASARLVIVPAHHYIPGNDISTIHTWVISHEYEMNDATVHFVTGRCSQPEEVRVTREMPRTSPALILETTLDCPYGYPTLVFTPPELCGKGKASDAAREATRNELKVHNARNPPAMLPSIPDGLSVRDVKKCARPVSDEGNILMSVPTVTSSDPFSVSPGQEC